MMFDHDRSAARGRLTPRGLFVFSHADAFGSAPAHRLTERVHVHRSGNDDGSVPRSFADYVISVDDSSLPPGVHLITLAA